MRTSIILLGLVLSFTSSALPASDAYHQNDAICQDYMIPVTVTSANFIFNGTKCSNLVDLVTDLARRPTALQPLPLFGGPVNQTASYELAGTFCTPKHTKDGHEKTVLLASHGGGVDGTYVFPHPLRSQKVTSYESSYRNSPYKPKE